MFSYLNFFNTLWLHRIFIIISTIFCYMLIATFLIVILFNIFTVRSTEHWGWSWNLKDQNTNEMIWSIVYKLINQSCFTINFFFTFCKMAKDFGKIILNFLEKFGRQWEVVQVQALFAYFASLWKLNKFKLSKRF